MKKSELLTKIYNDEIKEDNVIVEHDIKESANDRYILNDGFDYWYADDNILPLGWIIKDEFDEQYDYTLISEQAYENLMERRI